MLHFSAKQASQTQCETGSLFSSPVEQAFLAHFRETPLINAHPSRNHTLWESNHLWFYASITTFRYAYAFADPKYRNYLISSLLRWPKLSIPRHICVYKTQIPDYNCLQVFVLHFSAKQALQTQCETGSLFSSPLTQVNSAEFRETSLINAHPSRNHTLWESNHLWFYASVTSFRDAYAFASPKYRNWPNSSLLSKLTMTISHRSPANPQLNQNHICCTPDFWANHY